MLQELQLKNNMKSFHGRGKKLMIKVGDKIPAGDFRYKLS